MERERESGSQRVREGVRGDLAMLGQTGGASVRERERASQKRREREQGCGFWGDGSRGEMLTSPCWVSPMHSPTRAIHSSRTPGN